MLKHGLDLWSVGQKQQGFPTLLLSYLLLTLLSPLSFFTNEIDSATETDKCPSASKLKRLEKQIEWW